jgi:hypothetical protein
MDVVVLLHVAVLCFSGSMFFRFYVFQVLCLSGSIDFSIYFLYSISEGDE